MADVTMFGSLSIVGLLLCGNLWFVRRLVLKIDKLDYTVTSRLPVQQNEIKNMADKVQGLESEIKTLAVEIKHFGSVRERLAVIEAVLQRRKPKRMGE